MSEQIIALLFLLGLSTFCWVMVLRPSARQKLNEHGYRTWRVNKEGRETWDAMQFVGYLFGAVILSILTVIFFTFVSCEWSRDEGRSRRVYLKHYGDVRLFEYLITPDGKVFGAS